MGCEVLDVGRVTKPCHVFAVEHLQADAGIYVTGAGCAPQWTGLDLLGPRGIPWSLGESRPVSSQSAPASPSDQFGASSVSGDAAAVDCTLNDVERRFLAGVNRPTRQGGAQRYFDALVPYQAGLLKHFRDLRPGRLVVATSDPILLETLRGVFEPLPCDLIPISDPIAMIDPPTIDDRLAEQIRRIIKDADAFCGVAIAEDGQGVSFVDERGRVVPDSPITCCNWPISNGAIGRRASSTTAALGGMTCSRGVSVESVSEGRERLVSRLFEPDLGPGLEPGGRLWVKETVPVCDAILTIGVLLRALRTNRTPFSTLFS